MATAASEAIRNAITADLGIDDGLMDRSLDLPR
jgi:hypothetical protein